MPVHLLAHHYGGRFDEETVTAQGVETLSLTQYPAGGGAFPADTLVTVCLQPGDRGD